MEKKILVFRGGWDGHDPVQTSDRVVAQLKALVPSCRLLSEDAPRLPGVMALLLPGLPSEQAVADLEAGRVVIFGGGTGHPYFSTDTGAVLRAVEIGADVILLAKNIDGVYSADPRQDPAAVRYDEIRYQEVLARRLAVMDLTATSLAMDNHIPLLVFALKDPENILRALRGERVGTLVKE